ncbi:MAG: hypothetical protein ACREUW_01875 [Burkholderiales bacterium]
MSEAPARDVFAPALAAMARANAPAFGPAAFRAYLDEHDLAEPATAIAVDALRRLAPSLRDRGTMVFRLGVAPGSNAIVFALAKVDTGWSDYFLLDAEIFAGLRPKSFSPRGNPHHFDLLSQFAGLSGNALVALAASTGVLAEALQLDDGQPQPVPAAGQDLFTFPVLARPGLPVWTHRRGPVEIDGAFIATRRGTDTVFVVTARTGRALDSLAKHKLAYAAQAVLGTLPPGVAVVPVYLRVLKRATQLLFYFAECTGWRAGDAPPPVSAIAVRRTACFLLPRPERDPTLPLNLVQ